LKNNFILYVIYLSLGIFAFLRSHETNFGISPSTLHKGGIHVETNIIFSELPYVYDGSDKIHGRHRKTSLTRNETTLHYGITPEITMGLTLPWEKIETKNEHVLRSSSGLEASSIDAKYRFYKTDSFAGTTYASIIGIYKFGGPKTDSPALHSGNDSFLLGLGSSVVRPKLSFWLNGAIRFHDEESHFKPGDEIIASTALGYRPWIAEMNEIEINYMAELNYENQSRDEFSGQEVGNSGKEILFLTPGLRINYNRQLVKMAVQIPVYQKFHGEQTGFNFRAKIGWELMF